MIQRFPSPTGRGLVRFRIRLAALLALAMLCLAPGAALAGWVDACGGQVPVGAQPQGYEASGESLWVVRAQLSTRGQYAGVHPGKVRPAFNGANVPYGGKEVKAECYEVWVGPARWVPAVNGQVPRCAIPAGEEADGQPLFVARAYIEGGLHIGKVRPQFSAANIPYGGRELKVRSYEVLCQ